MVRHMSGDLYKDATAGDVRWLQSDIESVERNEELLSLTPEQNNCLHIAARFEHEEFVRGVLSHCPSLLYQQNNRGENPLHVAARAGHLHVVKLLTDSFQWLHPPPSSQSIESNPRNNATEGEEQPSEGFPTEADEGETRIQIQNQENITALTDSTQPPRISQSQNIRNSATNTAGDDIITERSQREAEEGERPSSPIRWMTQNQQISTNPTDSVQPPRISQNQNNRNSATTEDDIISERSLREAEEGERPTLPMWSTQNQQNTIGTLGSSPSESTGERSDMPIWITQNHDGSTPLHEALRSKHEDVAMHLLDLDLELLVVVVNAKGESPLYLAAEAGFIRVLTKILPQARQARHVSIAGPKGQTPIHAAVFAASSGSIRVLHESYPRLIRKRDSYGKTAVYYATQSGSIKILRLLLELDASSAYICDDEGLSPLLIAASVGQLSYVRAILNACPASIETSDNGGRNALHIAVLNCHLRNFEKLLRMPEMKTLINEPDHEGNTPLHLASMDHQYSKIDVLLSTIRVDLTIMNNVGQTAFDLCILNNELSVTGRRVCSENNILQEWDFFSFYIPWVLISYRFGAYRSLFALFYFYFLVLKYLRFPAGGSRIINADAKEMKQVANTQSIVAALLATITFAAAFTIPGGYKADGSPLLIHKNALKVFFLSDSIALCCSMVALFLLLRGTLHKNILQQTVDESLALILVAIFATMTAFVSGLHAVISIDSMWLAILVCIIGSSFYFLFRLMVRFGAFWTPSDPKLLRRQITGLPLPPPINN
ncbi:protein ACCELERATED CELL DEATH 6-like [Macadamia integrifolia]|uniref:protein ACCELERATED CELL DEATH 6-like n=1 Tax=Macadamia integrifolia TaxID=60698 RepID=UPI001C502095|nr:protein ACCELERATED CELL DEATH 6-like [Macadamia integrifolia]